MAKRNRKRCMREGMFMSMSMSMNMVTGRSIMKKGTTTGIIMKKGTTTGIIMKKGTTMSTIMKKGTITGITTITVVCARSGVL